MFAYSALQANTKTMQVATLRAKIARRDTTARVTATGSVTRALPGSTALALAAPPRLLALWATTRLLLPVPALSAQLVASVVPSVAQVRARNAPAANTKTQRAKRAARRAPL